MNPSGLNEFVLKGRCLIKGEAEGDLLWLDEPISFWGGVDPASGRIIDVRHPQHGASVRNKILRIPGTRGSTASPGALLETIYAGNGPCGVILARPDLVCVIAVTAGTLLKISEIPVLALGATESDRIRAYPRWHISGDRAWPAL